MQGGEGVVAAAAAPVDVANMRAAGPAVGHFECSPARELERFRVVKKLRNKLRKACAKEKVREPVLGFERWLCRCKLHQDDQPSAPSEPLLPCTPWVDTGFVADLRRVRMGEEAAQSLVRAMTLQAVEMSKQVAACGDAEDDGRVWVHAKPHTYHLTFPHADSKPYFVVNKAHHDKLRLLYDTHHAARAKGGDAKRRKSSSAKKKGKNKGEGDGDGDGDDDARFHRFLFSMLVRYEALGGHGYQAALDERSFEALLRDLEVNFECFASPLNCHYGRFCSAFADVDAAFGSEGSFFSFRPDEGSFEANPPFVPEAMSKAVEHIEDLLRSSSKPLSFVVIVPAWNQVRAWAQLTASKFLQGSAVVVPANEHGFCDGAQHMRRDRFRPSSFDSGVFVLQNPKGAERWPVDPAIIKRLREAMRSAVPASGSDIQTYEQRFDGRKRKAAAQAPPGKASATKSRPHKQQRR